MSDEVVIHRASSRRQQTQQEIDSRTEAHSTEASVSGTDVHPCRERTFPHHGSSVGEARKFAVEALSSWGVRHRLDDVCLCLSEVATNALVHAAPPSSGFQARLSIDAAGIRLEVHDQGAGRPHRRNPSPDDPRGRGLLLVEELSDAWGVADHQIGKTVWLTFKIATGGPRVPEPPVLTGPPL